MERLRKHLALLKSVQEDLTDRIKKENDVQAELQEEILLEREILEEYRQLHIQFQRNDRYFSLAAVPKNETDHLAQENKMLRLEVASLQNQLNELDHDKAALNSKISKEVDQDTEEEEEDPAGTTEEEALVFLEIGVAKIKADVQLASTAVKEMRSKVEREKQRAERMNGAIVSLLRGQEQVDIDGVILASTELRSKLDSLTAELLAKSAMSKNSRRTGGTARYEESKVITYSDAWRSLRLLGRRKELLQDGSSVAYLQKLALALLETLVVKQSSIENLVSRNKSLGKYVQGMHDRNLVEAEEGTEYQDRYRRQGKEGPVAEQDPAAVKFELLDGQEGRNFAANAAVL